MIPQSWSHLARSGLPAVSHKKNISRKPNNESFIDRVCLVKRLDIGLVFFCEFMDQYPAILTSHLVNNPYVTLSFSWE